MIAEVLATVPTKSTKSMDYEDRLVCIEQMMRDLDRLAREDGCIAAAWALEFLEELKCPFMTKTGAEQGGKSA